MRIGRIIFDRTEAGLSAFKQAGLYEKEAKAPFPDRGACRKNAGGGSFAL